VETGAVEFSEYHRMHKVAAEPDEGEAPPSENQVVILS